MKVYPQHGRRAPSSAGSTSPSSQVQYLEAAAQFQCNFTNTDKGLSRRERRMTPCLQSSQKLRLVWYLLHVTFGSCCVWPLSECEWYRFDYQQLNCIMLNWLQHSIYFILQSGRNCLPAANTAARTSFDQCFGQFLCSCQINVYNVMWNTLAQSCLVKAISQELQEWSGAHR